MFYAPLRRYRFRRFAVLRSIPLNSAPSSCAVISRWRSAQPSPNGTAYVPSSSAACTRQRSHRDPEYWEFSPGPCAGLANTNRCPANASNSRCSRTQRLQTVEALAHIARREGQRYTRTLQPAGRIIPEAAPARSAKSRCPRQCRCAVARRLPTPIPVPAPPCTLAGARSSPPGRTAPARFPEAVSARRRRSTPSTPAPYRIALRTFRCAVARRCGRPTPSAFGVAGFASVTVSPMTPECSAHQHTRKSRSRDAYNEEQSKGGAGLVSRPPPQGTRQEGATKWQSAAKAKGWSEALCAGVRRLTRGSAADQKGSAQTTQNRGSYGTERFLLVRGRQQEIHAALSIQPGREVPIH